MTLQTFNIYLRFSFNILKTVWSSAPERVLIYITAFFPNNEVFKTLRNTASLHYKTIVTGECWVMYRVVLLHVISFYFRLQLNISRNKKTNMTANKKCRYTKNGFMKNQLLCQFSIMLLVCLEKRIWMPVTKQFLNKF